MIYSVPKFINKLSINQNEVTGQKKKNLGCGSWTYYKESTRPNHIGWTVTRSPQVRQQLFEHSPTISFEIQKGFIRWMTNTKWVIPSCLLIIGCFL